ncbi:uncharacterized protein BO87DRAFT_87862 [Aspergillus neoniger CBS 115656]|uniref:Uncharacterized protein n=1 Tax=Aspergillus neoniger (strain CBS 115656) TaxID=1448310 RepID=A0A318ZA60_ASPNB|nr:hypothetical protein BO87DRAFT_87862 [Aspergillus neoniger CBS 115656]PYH33362.1 hypothetical protein BO87DRAFT_87862 [Aspergillus neoniger CBS 115656]
MTIIVTTLTQSSGASLVLGGNIPRGSWLPVTQGESVRYWALPALISSLDSISNWQKLSCRQLVQLMSSYPKARPVGEMTASASYRHITQALRPDEKGEWIQPVCPTLQPQSPEGIA